MAMADKPSGVSQSRKLGIKPGMRICLDHAPVDWQFIDAAPEVTFKGPRSSADVIIGFFTNANQIQRRLPTLIKRIYPDGSLWIAWPRRAAGHISDITDNIVREIALPLGIVDVKIAAIDDDWSGLRFVWRVSNRSKSK